MRGPVCAVVLAVAAAGCGGGSAAPVGAAVTEASLAELKELLQVHGRTAKGPLGRPADVRRHEAAFPDVAALVQSGELVYVWGAGPDPASQGVLAYPKAAAEAGGFVLLQDGTVKSMTAAEFAAAPKAGGKK